MIFRQLFDSVSGTYTYLLASRRGGEALIIDPVIEKVDRYLQLIGELDLRLVKAVDTHLHADHVTGLGALRDRTHCITVMGEQSKADVVSMRLAEGEKLTVEGVSLDVLYTPGHTDDSYSYLMGDRVFTGDTLLIRGTGRTDFQNGDPRAQFDSIFNKLLRLPEDTLVYPAHDYKGEQVSTIGEERAFNPRLQVKSVDEYVALMNGLNLPNPKMMDVAVPANMKVGLAQDEIARRGWAVDAAQAVGLIGRADVAFIDLREKGEQDRHGLIPGSLHAPYPDLRANIAPGGMLRALAANRQLLFYCAFGERSAMAVQAAQDARLGACHLTGGIDAWKKAGGPLERAATAMKHRVALVTGAAHGIGRATVRHLLDDGWLIGAVDLAAADLDRAFGKQSRRVRMIEGDIGDEATAKRAVGETMERFGQLDGVVSNAGIMIRKPIRQLTIAEWRRVLDVNLTAAFLLAKAAERPLRASEGAFVSIASTRAAMSEPNTEAYSASKGGLVALTHALAMSIAPVRVNCVSPGWIATKDYNKLRRKDHVQHPAGRVGKPEDIAEIVAWLLDGERSGFVTGANFTVDGGMTRKMIYEE